MNMSDEDIAKIDAAIAAAKGEVWAKHRRT
jgi:hypothetical protein